MNKTMNKTILHCALLAALTTFPAPALRAQESGTAPADGEHCAAAFARSRS